MSVRRPYASRTHPAEGHGVDASAGGYAGVKVRSLLFLGRDRRAGATPLRHLGLPASAAADRGERQGPSKGRRQPTGLPITADESTQQIHASLGNGLVVTDQPAADRASRA